MQTSILSRLLRSLGNVFGSQPSVEIDAGAKVPVPEKIIGLQPAVDSEAEAKMAALDKTLAIIEFDTSGNILHANANFLEVMGYTLAEVKGNHHSMFVSFEYSKTSTYRDFWLRLAEGKPFSDEYKRIGKNGREVWIQASYNPVLAPNGHVQKVVKFATDITQEKTLNLDLAGQIDAINRSQAVIEFDLQGNILAPLQSFKFQAI
ncbi:PAS domain-containing protein [Enterovibrio nigricans]|uniref:PAS domain S-box-containing protein n=1 Tax=Enterovibrio nigricans DSM 22720 TaxID=1121868 RepID=A0A1T4VU39_9GAMM|nr:PAS domain-containing protein [Enterovibrio nigricans]PKF49103.1 PAS domain S-box protein [Enterovibrio nigricans]SKA68457.1 PAS domain S-box-containing protein [Enterovibrio nigricans DSM 22720]